MIIKFRHTGIIVSDIIKSTNTGAYFQYSEYDKLKSLILEHFEAFTNNNLKTHPIGLEQYSRKSLTQKLSKLI